MPAYGTTAKVDVFCKAWRDAEAIMIGAGAGMSASAGLVYDGPRFESNFADFVSAYGYHDMYTAGFYPYPTLEEKWAYWSRHIFLNRYEGEIKEPYATLLDMVQGRDYFVLTTNVDHCFQRTGFDKRRLFYTQGDYGLWQCSRPCHASTYDNEATVRKMVAEQSGMKVPSDLVPYCPKCGAPMAMNLRADNTFVQDAGWDAARGHYDDFVEVTKGKRILLLELGVGGNTPAIIKYPFWRLALENPAATYVCINKGEAYAPEEIGQRAICLDGDIAEILVLAQKGI